MAKKITMPMTSTRSYSELSRLASFEDRFNYLKLGGKIGSRTFGGNRYLNQRLYQSYEWRKFRDSIIVRDDGCDLGIPGYDISWRIHIHHINPLTEYDLKELTDSVLDPNNVITTSFKTHEAIHYADTSLLLPSIIVERTPNDTCPWKEGKCQTRHL